MPDVCSPVVAGQAAAVLRAPVTAVSGSAARPLADGAALAGADIGLVVVVQASSSAETLDMTQPESSLTPVGFVVQLSTFPRTCKTCT